MDCLKISHMNTRNDYIGRPKSLATRDPQKLETKIAVKCLLLLTLYYRKATCERLTPYADV